jgi:integrase
MKDQNGDWIYLKPEEALALIAEVRPAEKWRLPVKLLHYYGLRCSEVLSLTSKNLRDGELVIQRLKRGRITRQFLIPEIREEFLALIASKHPGSRLFPYCRKSLWERVHEAGNRLGMDPRKCHPHSFRHGAGRRWARKGTLSELNAMLGHSPKSFTATVKYISLACDAELSKKFLVTATVE